MCPPGAILVVSEMSVGGVASRDPEDKDSAKLWRWNVVPPSRPMCEPSYSKFLFPMVCEMCEPKEGLRSFIEVFEDVKSFLSLKMLMHFFEF